jgi:hypothetical protein
MPITSTVGGTVELKGLGGAHPGVAPVDTSASTAAGSIGTMTVTAGGWVSSGTTPPGYPSGYYPLSISSVSGSRVAFDPFGQGAITYTLPNALSGTITSVSGATVTISGSTSGMAQGSDFTVYFSGGGTNAQQSTYGGVWPGTWYVASVVSGNQVTLATTYGNAIANSPTTFQSYNTSYTVSGLNYVSGALPSGLSFNSSTGTVSGAISINSTSNPGYNNGMLLNYPPSGGLYDGRTVPTTSYQFKVRATDALGINQTDRQYSINLSVPYAYRQVITTTYLQAGYANSSCWQTTCRTTNSTDTTIDLGSSGYQEVAHNYQMSAHNLTRSFTFGAGSAHCAAASNVIAFNMRTETANTAGYSRGYPVSQNNCSTLRQEYYYAWCTSPAATTVYEMNLTTEQGYTAPTSCPGPNALTGNSWDGYGVWMSQNYNMTYSNRTVTSRGGTTVTGDAQGKVMEGKINAYGGREGCPSTNWRRTVQSTNTSVDAAGAKPYNSGEENNMTGQDWGYCIGFYGPAGHVNTSFKFIYATEAGYGTNASLEAKGGHAGNSSGTTCWRD